MVDHEGIGIVGQFGLLLTSCLVFKSLANGHFVFQTCSSVVTEFVYVTYIMTDGYT